MSFSALFSLSPTVDGLGFVWKSNKRDFTSRYRVPDTAGIGQAGFFTLEAALKLIGNNQHSRDSFKVVDKQVKKFD